MNRVKYAFGVFILGLAAYYGHGAWSQYQQTYGTPDVASDATVDTHGWITTLEAGLAQASAEQKPVFIDFWATWCKNCIVMDNKTFKDPAVVEAFKSYVLVKYQAEDPSAPPAREVMEHFNVLGLPTYIVLKPKG